VPEGWFSLYVRVDFGLFAYFFCLFLYAPASTREMGKNHGSVVVLRILVRFWL
jgi:hypothetical protein